jgi:hypothetical protein
MPFLISTKLDRRKVMAATRLITIHAMKGKTIAETYTERIDYAENPNKTKNGELVTGYMCDPLVADTQFLLAYRQYQTITGRDQGKKGVLAYHTRQSFKPGEITPQEANQIGYELALSFTKGKHQFTVSTHVDKAHIHNHIIFNAISLDCTRKFRNFWGSYAALRRLSDQICVEHGVSIIENPKPSKGGYGTWMGVDKPLTWQEKLRQNIDAALEEKHADMASFIKVMQEAGYEVKQGKYLAFKAPGQKRFTRLRSLSDDYTDEAILERIEGKRAAPERRARAVIIETATVIREAPKMNLLIDIQNSIKAKNSPGYEQWAKVFNLKQAAQTLIFLQENNLTEYAKLEEKSAEATKHFNDLTVSIKEKESRLHEISALQKQISNYSRTRSVYTEYRKAGYSKKFLAEHEGDIIIHQAAKKAFDELGLKKLPTIKSLKEEYAAILAEKKKLYQSYHKAKDDMQKLAVAKSNTDRLLNYSASGKGKEKDSPRR